MDRVIIFDTTLRDGEQAAGGSLNVQEKLEIARQLEKLGVDVIEAGFPVTSPGDFEAVKLISQEVHNASVCALMHANLKAIDESWEAIKTGANPRIHVVLSSVLPAQEEPRADRRNVLRFGEARPQVHG
jgi:2-isopropylmalate synthase